MKKFYRPVDHLVSDLNVWLANTGYTQSYIADKSGINQATVHRILKRGRRQRISKAIVKLCNYANIDPYVVEEVDPSSNKELMNALQFTWDGSLAHAKKLARVIRELGNLSNIDY